MNLLQGNETVAQMYSKKILADLKYNSLFNDTIKNGAQAIANQIDNDILESLRDVSRHDQAFDILQEDRVKAEAIATILKCSEALEEQAITDDRWCMIPPGLLRELHEYTAFDILQEEAQWLAW